MKAKYFLTPKTSLDGFFAFGRALEGPGLKDTFYSLGPGITQYLSPELALSLRGSIYRAQLYSENRITLGADWFF